MLLIVFVIVGNYFFFTVQRVTCIIQPFYSKVMPPNLTLYVLKLWYFLKHFNFMLFSLALKHQGY